MSRGREAAITLAQVTVRFRDTVALDDITLDVPMGETTVLIGPSGCGKSTLVKTVIGLLVPEEGEVAVEGTPMMPDTARHLRRHMGYVIQEGGLFPHLTAAGNITLMAAHLGVDSEARAARLQDLVALTQFPEDGLTRYPAELSGGQHQRVSLMRALMLDPDILLMDEPLGALDPIIRYEMQDELKAIFARLGKTVVLVTHDMAEAVHFGHTIVLMNAGHIEQRGTAADLLAQPASDFAARFIRSQRRGLDVEGPWG